ncbi:MAG: DegT/DnrJ/EryC1/StrS family aminotransferase [Thermoguttaceae bacterium]
MKGNFNNEDGILPYQQPVQLLDLHRHHGPIMDEMVSALRSVCESGAFVLGPEVKKLENSVAAYCQVDHAIGCASGSDALLLALLAADIQPGDEVIVPSFTFFATASSVTRLGVTPIFADIDADSYNISVDDIRRKFTARTKAIIPVHLYGQMVEMKEILQIAEQNKALVVEDAAQAIGAELEGRRAGSWGHITALSFYPTKNLGGAGDGGMLTTPDADYAKKLTLLRGHGMEPRYYHQIVGINSRLDSLQAAILNVKMRHLEGWTMMRCQNAQRYHDLFSVSELEREVSVPKMLPNRRHVWNQYVIRVPDGRRDALRQALAARKIGSEIYYPLGLHEQQCFQSLGYAPEDLPETFRASREVLALPIYPELTADEQHFVVESIKDFYAENSARRLFPVGAPTREAA